VRPIWTLRILPRIDMPVQIECPGCKVMLQVPDELAGKQGKCIHCGQRLTVPGRASVGTLSPSLFEASPESMVRELHRRQQSALLLIFPLPGDGSYDLANVPDSELKCIATEDINQGRFAQLVESFTKRFGPRKRVQQAPAAAPSPASVIIASPAAGELLFELKGDRLGMSIEEFRGKYNRSGEGGQRLPLCSDTSWGANKASLRS